MAKRANSGHKSREAYLAYHKAWREKNKEHIIAWRKKYRGPRGTAHRKDRYGLTEDDYNRMVAEQGGKCALCRIVPGGKGTMAVLRVDHCHTTGEVRALLCHKCNAGLGMFGDNALLIERAAMYVRHHALRRRESA